MFIVRLNNSYLSDKTDSLIEKIYYTVVTLSYPESWSVLDFPETAMPSQLSKNRKPYTPLLINKPYWSYHYSNCTANPSKFCNIFVAIYSLFQRRKEN